MKRARTAAVGLMVVACVLAGRQGLQMAAGDDDEQPSAVGVWNLSGVDEQNTIWIATLVVAEKADGLKGHIDWLSNNGNSGREHITAVYDPAERRVTLTGVKLEFANSIVRGVYGADLSRDGSRLENGKWSDVDPTIPGRWSAQRIVLR